MTLPSLSGPVINRLEHHLTRVQTHEKRFYSALKHLQFKESEFANIPSTCSAESCGADAVFGTYSLLTFSEKVMNSRGKQYAKALKHVSTSNIRRIEALYHPAFQAQVDMCNPFNQLLGRIRDAIAPRHLIFHIQLDHIAKTFGVDEAPIDSK